MTLRWMSVAGSVALVSLLAVAYLFATREDAHAVGVEIIVTTTSPTAIPDGVCNLSEAITASNTGTTVNGDCTGTAEHDTITFNLGTGTPSIPTTFDGLPHITAPVTILGNTNGATRVELRGPGGPLVSGKHGLTIEPTGAGTTIRGLVINNQADDGILIDADEVTLLGSFIGTDAAGVNPLPNQGFGVQVKHNGVRIGGVTDGGQCTGDCNLISGGLKANVLLDIGSTGAFVRGNFIGTDVTGTRIMTPNDTQGVVDKGTGNQIGGSIGTTPGGACTGDCNLISGNAINGGVVVDPIASGTRIKGNFIGTDVSGTLALSNGFSPGFSIGILSYSSGDIVIGGNTPAERNVISGNRGANVQIRGIGTALHGNYIGTNSAGTAAIDQSASGVFLTEANGTKIGGAGAGEGNLISGASTNGGYGIWIEKSVNVVVRGNVIGLAANGITPIPNVSDGIIIRNQASNNIIGGQIAGAGNTIAFNGRDGVHMDNQQAQVRSNTVSGNSIYSNVGKGIALLTGANDVLQPPVITGTSPVSGTACAQCTIEVFSDGTDEGRQFEGSALSDNAGSWTLNEAVSGPNITATATDNSNNTSEFSAAVTLPGAVTPTPTLGPTPSPTPTATPFSLTIGDVNCDGAMDTEDAAFLLEFAGGLTGGQQSAPCPGLGEPFGDFLWADLNCDGSVDALDALVALSFLVGIEVPAATTCLVIGLPD